MLCAWSWGQWICWGLHNDWMIQSFNQNFGENANHCLFINSLLINLKDWEFYVFLSADLFHLMAQSRTFALSLFKIKAKEIWLFWEVFIDWGYNSAVKSQADDHGLYFNNMLIDSERMFKLKWHFMAFIMFVNLVLQKVN